MSIFSFIGFRLLLPRCISSAYVLLYPSLHLLTQVGVLTSMDGSRVPFTPRCLHEATSYRRHSYTKNE